MTAIVASNGQTTAPVVTVPNRVTIGFGGTHVHASSKPSKTGIKYRAKARINVTTDSRSDEELLIAAAQTVEFEGHTMPLASTSRHDDGSVKVGLSQPLLTKDGSVRRPGRPMVTLWESTKLGDGEGIAFQALVKLTIERTTTERFVQVQADITRRPDNAFKPEGEVEGPISF